MSLFEPKRCIIETPYKCNLKCQTCTLWKENYRKLREEFKDNFNEKEFKQLYDSLLNFKVKRISFIGGEPFLNKNFLNIVKQANQIGFISNTVTNGTCLTKENIKDIVENKIFNTLIFSLDGPKNIHNFIRGKANTFETVYENIKFLQKIKNKYKTGKPKIYIYTTISSLNYLYLEEIYKIALSLNVNKIRFQLVSSIDEKIINETNEILGFNAIKTHSYINKHFLDDEKLNKVKKTLIKIKNNSKNNLKIETENILDFKKIENCNFIGKDFIITPNFNVLICPMLNNFSIGNIKDENINDMFIKNEYKINLILKLSNEKKLPICKECCVEKLR